ncbi:hypothetical protein [Clostridium sp.]|uniref:hypothetical protein n=1 Tax=Clostridium sp. TaxID=1506 RepID=UPI003F2C85C4
MALIKQEPLKKIKEQEVALLIPEEIIKEITEYCRVVGITRGYERNGEAKTSIEARREYFIVEAIKQILDRDRDDLEALKNEQSSSTVDEIISEDNSIKPILQENFNELVSMLEGE